jgi:hypothetical protein
MRFACRIRKQRSASVSFPTPDQLLRRRPADSSRGALRPSHFGFRQVHQDPICIGIPRHLTIRSSRPHVVASAACFTLRLHASAAPPRVGLTQALGGKKHSVVLLCKTVTLSASASLALRTQSRPVLLRPGPSGALTLRMRCVARLRKRRLAWSVCPLPIQSLRVQPADRSRGALKQCGFATPRPPNNSFKPTPHRGSARVLALR